MALTFSALQRHSAGDQFKVTGLMTFDDSYPTGGESMTAGALGLSVIDSMEFEDSGGYSFDAIIATGGASALIKAWRSAGFTPSGAIALTAGTAASGTNAASNVSSAYISTQSCVKPVIALTHNADPVGGLAASLLYLVEGYGGSTMNCGTLQSNCAGTTDISGSTADGTVWLTAATPRFYVAHSLTPAGVQIYVNEASSDQLEFVSPTATDGYIVMPYEAIANVPPGFAVRVKIHHSATAATGKALYFDDNGAADAQLAFVDAGTAGGVVPAADIDVIGPDYVMALAGHQGTAAAQTITMVQPTFTAALTGAAVAESAFNEVDNTTNLSTLSIGFSAFGK